MNILAAKWKLITVVVVIVIVVVGVAILFLHNSAPQRGVGQNATGTANTSTTVTNGIPGSNGSSTASAVTHSPSSGGGAKNIPPLPGPAITIDLLTPISGNVWTIGQPNSIAWDNSANITGEIDLVNANTKAFVGVILSETGPKQTSYSWDARSIYLARYSADKKDVVAGTYSIRIHFDGNGLGDLVSGPITITN